MPAKHRLFVLLAALGIFSAVGVAHAATVVALGASNTYGMGVSRSEAYPAQLQALLRARGLNVQIINAGINGDTTAGILARLDQAVPRGTSVVVFQPGGNDLRQHSPDQSSARSPRRWGGRVGGVCVNGGSREGKAPRGTPVRTQGSLIL